MSLKVETDVKLNSDPCVLDFTDNLYVGTEDGSIECFDPSLKPKGSWSAHSVQVFALTAGGGRVYSSSNDGGIRVWSPTGEKIKELKHNGDVVSLKLFNGQLFAGDEGGIVVVFENDEIKAKYSVVEEVKDLAVNLPLIYTVRDLDVTVTEIKPAESKSRYHTKHTMEGRAPIRLAGQHLVVMARDGKVLKLHDNNPDTKFKLLHEVNASDMIVTSIAVSPDNTVVWTGGWDGKVRRWQLQDSKLVPSADIDVGSCINAIVSTAPDSAFVAAAGGKVMKIRS